MIYHNWTVICRSSSIDKTSNNISLFEIIEQLTIDGPNLSEGEKIAIPFPLQVVTLWSRAIEDKPEKSKGRLVFVDPNGKEEVLRDSFPIEVETHSRMRTRLLIGAIPYSGPGLYLFRIDYFSDDKDDWVPIHTLPFYMLNSTN